MRQPKATRTLRPKVISFFSALALIVAATSTFAQTAPAGKAGAAQGPTNVGTVTLHMQDVPFVRTLPGRAVAFETGEIRSRVSAVWSRRSCTRPGMC